MKSLCKSILSLIAIIGVALALYLAIWAANIWLFYTIATYVGKRWAIAILAFCMVSIVVKGMSEED